MPIPLILLVPTSGSGPCFHYIRKSKFLSVLDAFGVTDKLIHVDYCNILPENDPRFYKEMVESVLGSAERYDIDRSILFDCQKDLDSAVENIRNAINASSADNPLYYILAGPMEVPYQGIIKSPLQKNWWASTGWGNAPRL